MHRDKIFDLLINVQNGTIDAADAFESLKDLPFEDLEHTKIDHHRSLRKGIQEIVYGEGKTLDQLLSIIKAVTSHGQDVLVTRVDQGEKGSGLVSAFPEGTYDALSRCFTIKTDMTIRGKGTILIISAGTSDSAVAEEAFVTSTFLGNITEKLYDVGVAGIHRIVHNLDILRTARVIIVVAGMEGALPSIVAGMVGTPVIAVPTSTGYGASFGGLAALLGMLNSCSTVSVFNIDNGFGAAYFATLINRL